MTDQTPKSSNPISSDRPLNRRGLLKVAVATAPIIATLPSGAALARSSNLVGPTSGNGQDGLGRTLCLELNSGTYENGVLDLGPVPSGNLTAINERDWYADSNGAAPVTEAEMCKQGGEYFYKAGGWSSGKTGPGIVISATAWSSLAGSLLVREI